MKIDEITKPKLRNPVAKNMDKVNRGGFHSPKKYTRKEKHKVKPQHNAQSY